MDPERMQGLSEKDRQMMGLEPEAEVGEPKEAAQLREEIKQAIVEAFGTEAEAQRYATMELTDRTLHPNPDAPMEEGLVDKILIARNFTGALEHLRNIGHPTEGNRELGRARSSLESATTSEAFANLTGLRGKN